MNQSQGGVKREREEDKKRDKKSLNLKYSNMKWPSGDDEEEKILLSESMIEWNPNMQYEKNYEPNPNFWISSGLTPLG